MHQYNKYVKLTIVTAIASIIAYIGLRLYVNKLVTLDLSKINNPQNWLTIYYVLLAILGVFVLSTICMIAAYFISRHKEIKKYGKRRNGRM